VGQRGSRVQTIIGELGGEKIDIIEYSEDQEKFIANALAPAKVMSIELDEAEHKAIVKVSPDKLSLAIGKAGQNVRLAARLSGWKIDIIEASEEGEKKVLSADEEKLEMVEDEEAATTSEVAEAAAEVAPAEVEKETASKKESEAKPKTKKKTVKKTKKE